MSKKYNKKTRCEICEKYKRRVYLVELEETKKILMICDECYQDRIIDIEENENETPNKTTRK